MINPTAEFEDQLKQLTEQHGCTAVLFAMGELMRNLPDSEANRQISAAASHLDNACLETAVAEDKVEELNDWVTGLTPEAFADIDDFV
ncbi:MAG: hypothetical protein AAGF01_06360 [Cyanobacteria bacterium P01_G01_bin.38]